MKKNEKLELATLKLKSFVTSLDLENKRRVHGGNVPTIHTACFESNTCAFQDPGPHDNL